MNTIMITCTGDADYRRRLRFLSLKHGRTIADLVREAVDAKYGDELTANFFENGFASTQKSDAEKLNPAHENGN